MTTKKRKSKPPRVVLLDTRNLADLGELTGQLRSAVSELAKLLPLMTELAGTSRQLLTVTSELHAAQQRRSEAARRANQTRRTNNGAPPAAPIPAAGETEETNHEQ